MSLTTVAPILIILISVSFMLQSEAAIQRLVPLPKELVDIDGNTYYIGSLAKLDWESAVAQCHALGMVLVSLETAEKEASIFNYIKSIAEGQFYTFWTSGGVVFKKWMWTSKGQLFTYANWADGEPSTTPQQEPCMRYLINYENEKFHAALCTDEVSIICEMPLQSLNKTLKCAKNIIYIS